MSRRNSKRTRIRIVLNMIQQNRVNSVQTGFLSIIWTKNNSIDYLSCSDETGQHQRSLRRLCFHLSSASYVSYRFDHFRTLDVCFRSKVTLNSLSRALCRQKIFVICLTLVYYGIVLLVKRILCDHSEYVVMTLSLT
jgi:hypothetical protein